MVTLRDASLTGSGVFFGRSRFTRWHEHFKAALADRMRPGRHGDLDTWLAALETLPDFPPAQFTATHGVISAGQADTLETADLHSLESGLRALQPWRKGPFRLFDIELDAEWRSDMKWDRVMPHLDSLRGQSVLDVGCGNGYFCWRILDQGAAYVMGIDPSIRFLFQFLAVQKYIQHPDIDLLPLRSEDMPGDMACFDTVFSMGVIYHRRHPEDHLEELSSFLKPGGHLVLETLVLPQPEDGVLVPEGRYAQMRNVWFIPAVQTMVGMLEQAGFQAAQCVNISRTTVEEQRCTEWMQFQSLEHFIDPVDPELTVEGHPAPIRAIFMALKPE